MLSQIKAGIASAAGDYHALSTWLIAAWRSALLTGLLFVIDILGDKEVVIAQSYVWRVRKLLDVIQASRSVWHRGATVKKNSCDLTLVGGNASATFCCAGQFMRGRATYLAWDAVL